MSISFYDLTVGSYLQIVEAATGVLRKGAEHFAAEGIDPAEFVEHHAFTREVIELATERSPGRALVDAHRDPARSRGHGGLGQWARIAQRVAAQDEGHVRAAGLASRLDVEVGKPRVHRSGVTTR